MAFGDWVAGSDQPSGLRQVAGGIAAAGEATGESIYKGVFKPVGTAIGEGAAALYLELTEPPAWAQEIEHEVQRRAWLHRQRELSVAREHKLEEAREEKDRAELAELQKSVREDRPLGTSGRVVTHASVGDGGRNDPADVHRIGARLHALGFLEATTDDPEEVADAIRMYQLAVLGQRHPTGRVRPGDATIRALSAGRKQSTMALP
jgi:hypothetical protein